MRRRKKPEHPHSSKDYEAALAAIKTSGLSKRMKKRKTKQLINRWVEMLG